MFFFPAYGFWQFTGASLSIACSIFLALAVYYDAKQQENKNALVWAILTGFFKIIALIIYLIVRNRDKNRLVICEKCRKLTNKSLGYCIHCNSPIVNQNNSEEYKDKIKIFATLAIVFYALSFIIKAFQGAGTLYQLFLMNL